MKLQPNETPDALMFALRLTEVSRWGIVATSRQQSVGEHSYRVCMIALALYDYMENGQSHNSFDRIHIAAFAMTHDIFEVLSGDVDSIFKIAVKAQYPGVFDTVTKSMAHGRKDASALYDEVSGIERAAKGSVVEIVVKIADFLEAIVYLDTYGTNSWHRGHVVANINERLHEFIAAKKASTVSSASLDWDRIEAFVNMIQARTQIGVPVRSAPQNA